MGGDALTANARYKGALKLDSSRYDLWEAFTSATLAVNSDDYEVKDRTRTEATAGAINAYLRAEDPDAQAFSLQMLAKSLANREIWKPAIKTARKALAIKPDTDFAGLMEGWIAEHGFRIADNTVDTAADEPRLCVSFSEPIAKDDPNIADFVTVDGGEKLAVRPRTSRSA